GGGASVSLTVIVTSEPVRTLDPIAEKDDGDWGYRMRAIWQAGDPENGWQGDYRIKEPGDGSGTATWVTRIPAGQYEVFATWTAYPENASDAPYRIFDGRNVLGSVERDQRQAPDDGQYQGRFWESLGVYDISTGVPTIELSDLADGNVVADGILFVLFVDAKPPMVPDEPSADLNRDGFVDLLERMGCRIERRADALTVQAPPDGQRLRGIDVDLNEMPDMVQTLAVLALFAEGPTHIRRVANLRLKETDRLSALAKELTAMGAKVEEEADGLRIVPPPRVRAATIKTYDDHRMAMSFALAGLAVEGVVIDEPECVAKTFPDFFNRWAQLTA
ncbi:MAG: hypothetical protein IID39_09860, partial [Planctomycetes bacterium]|nr:hypothetical protein [Planctomycetota bacterium]